MEKRRKKDVNRMQDSNGQVPQGKGILQTHRGPQEYLRRSTLGALSKVSLHALIIKWNLFAKQQTIPSPSHYFYEVEIIHLV